MFLSAFHLLVCQLSFPPKWVKTENQLVIQRKRIIHNLLIMCVQKCTRLKSTANGNKLALVVVLRKYPRFWVFKITLCFSTYSFHSFKIAVALNIEYLTEFFAECSEGNFILFSTLVGLMWDFSLKKGNKKSVKY